MLHDDLDPGFGLCEGGVTFVQTRQPGANEIGIRLDDRATEMLRPRRRAVHLLPIDTAFRCWRCDAIADGSADADPAVAA